MAQTSGRGSWKQEAPNDEEIAKLLSEVAQRVTKMLHAHGRMLDDESDDEAEPQLLFAGRPAPTSSGPQHEGETGPAAAQAAIKGKRR